MFSWPNLRNLLAAKLKGSKSLNTLKNNMNKWCHTPSEKQKLTIY